MEETQTPENEKASLLDKFKIVFLPYLLLNLAILVGYTLLRWLVDIELQLVSIKAEILDLWIPLILPILVVGILLRKRVRILDVPGAAGNGYFAYLLIAGITVGLPLIFIQSYLQKACYSLTKLADPLRIDVADPQRYYEFDDYAIDSITENNYGAATSFSSGRDNVTANVYVAIPFHDKAFLSGEFPRVWYCHSYSRVISDPILGSQVEEKSEAFINESLVRWGIHKFHTEKYFENLPNSEDRDGFRDAVSIMNGYDAALPLVLLQPRLAPFEERTGSTLSWFFIALGLGNLVFLCMSLFPNTHPEGFAAFLAGKEDDSDEFKEVIGLLIPRGDHLITSVIIDLNILVFLVMVLAGVSIMSPQPQQLLAWGADNWPLVQAGEYWRPFLAMFEHSGLVHVGMNMVAMAVIGMCIEPILKRGRFLAIYLLAGLAGSIATYIWLPGSVSVGASGAIFGLMGGLAALLVTNVIPKGIKTPYWVILASYGGISLVLGFFDALTNNAAHLAGLGMGFLGTLLFVVISKKRLLQNALQD